ncbi:MAG TPA: lysine--tRNA ligase [Candidatus Krumholzibacteria bacterium]|nr:lysine--tRNA ligase [Candidatus Krumholzibacteria bacterium]
MAEHLHPERLAKLEAWRRAGQDPYPYAFARTHRSDAVRAQEGQLAGQEIAIAGRMVTQRTHGKTAFAHVQDGGGRLQVYARLDDLGAAQFEVWGLLEVGDIVGVRGELFRTRTDELTVRVREFQLLSKAMRPLPDKWHGLADKEVRYRQRYVDLIVNEEVRAVFVKRSRLLACVRTFLGARGWLEVETPVLQPLYGGATARPFATHHNALDTQLYLRIAPELYLKRLLVGGFEGVFEIARNFRNEGMDRTHNPEFTMLELYVALWDYQDMLRLTEEMLVHAADEVLGSRQLVFGGQALDFTPPFARVKYFDALERAAGSALRRADNATLGKVAEQHGIDTRPDAERGELLEALFSTLVEPHLLQPTFVLDHPQEISPLAKRHRSEAGVVERFELFAAGMELANAFSELNDPLEQRQRFEAQLQLRAGGALETHPLDEDFLRALEYGMPPASGLGVGLDRVAMLWSDSASIRDVLLFPAMRPESPESDTPETCEKG